MPSSDPPQRLHAGTSQSISAARILPISEGFVCLSAHGCLSSSRKWVDVEPGVGYTIRLRKRCGVAAMRWGAGRVRDTDHDNGHLVVVADE